MMSEARKGSVASGWKCGLRAVWASDALKLVILLACLIVGAGLDGGAIG